MVIERVPATEQHLLLKSASVRPIRYTAERPVVARRRRDARFSSARSSAFHKSTMRDSRRSATEPAAAAATAEQLDADLDSYMQVEQ